MKRSTRLLSLFSFCTLPSLALADVEALVYNNQLELSGLNDQQAYQLKLIMPDGQLMQLQLQKSNSILFTASDFNTSSFPDGQYKYELVPIKDQLSKLRTSDTTPVNNKQTNLLSGTFSVKEGTTVIDQDEDTRAQVFTQDVIVQGSECIGFDCVNGEAFGFDTLRLKENNLRIRFMDTSSSASFPSNDWELTANDTTNGGLNRFSITDIDGGKTPFTIEAGAKNNALYIDDSSRVGIGTSTPVVEVHVTDGDTPTLRLEQNSSSGWTAQTWDVAGNEANFFVRDATNGSTLPFKIKPGAPSDAFNINSNSVESKTDTFKVFDGDTPNKLVVTANGRIGFGTSAPTHGLHVSRNENIALVLENSTTNEAWKISNKGSSLQYGKTGSLTGRFEFFETGQFQIGDPSARIFDLEANGNLTITGSLSQNSDVNSKENIQIVNPAEILQKVTDLPISVWNYKFDADNIRHLGPMAQDFYKLFGLGAREDKIATLDTTGVALASIKALANKVNEKESQINKLKNENENLHNRLKALEDAFTKLSK